MVLEGERGAKRTVVHSLKVVHQSQNVLVAHRHPLQYCDLIPNLQDISVSTDLALRGGSTYHVFPPGHETLVDDFRRVVATGVDVHTFLHDRVRASAQCLSGFVSARLDLRLLAGGWWCRHNQVGGNAGVGAEVVG